MAKKKHVPKLPAPQCDFFSFESTLPPDHVSALKNANQQIGLLEVQQRKLLEELAFLQITLQDLAASRLDNKDLRSQKNALEGELCKCREALAESHKTIL